MFGKIEIENIDLFYGQRKSNAPRFPRVTLAEATGWYALRRVTREIDVHPHSHVELRSEIRSCVGWMQVCLVEKQPRRDRRDPGIRELPTPPPGIRIFFTKRIVTYLKRFSMFF